MAEAFIAGAVRTPIGRRNGSLAGVNPVDLGRWWTGPGSIPPRSTT
jgi:acetyl-CoA acetyltransferase